MNKHILCLALASALTATSSMGAVILNLSGNPSTGPQFVVGTGTNVFVLDGSLVRVGTFLAPPDPAADFVTLSAGFREFGRTTIGHSTAAAPVNQGRINRTGATAITGTDTPESPDPDSFFVDKTVYIWVYDTATPNALSAQGIFSTAQFTFKDQAVAVSTSVNQYLTPFGKAGGAAGISNPASVDTVVNGAPPPANIVSFFHLSQVVPEPTTVATMGLLGVLGLMRRRR